MINPPFHPDDNRYDGKMSYQRCGRSGLLLPRISLGLWHNFGDIYPFATSRDMLHFAFDNGITCFDLANNYGPSYGSAEKTGTSLRLSSAAALRPSYAIASDA